MCNKELHNIRVCYDYEKEDPGGVKCDPPSDDAVKVVECNEEVAESHKNLTDVNKRLISFQLKPAVMKGEYLFKHVIKFCSTDPKIRRHSKSLKARDHLNVGLSKDNEETLQFSSLGLTKREMQR